MTPPIRRAEPHEIKSYIEDRDSRADELWYCGCCNMGQNEWNIPDMLWSILDEFLVTPCCHTEAALALIRYDAPKFGAWE